jgi:intein-encoded DNA endonuclease-like protein
VIYLDKRGDFMRKGMEFEHHKPEWIKLYNEGKSFTEIAKMYNCNKNTVGRTLEGPGRIKYF